MTFSRQFESNARKSPERIAFRVKTARGYREVSYGEVCRQSRLVATGLIAMGLQARARVAIVSENRPEWVIACIGIYMAGATVVPLDAQISEAEWRRLLDDSESHTVFVSGMLLPKLQAAVQNSRPPRRIICFDPLGGDRDARSELSGLVDWASCIGNPPALPETSLSDVANIIYTSGTTGKPKGVMLTQQNIVSELDAILPTIHPSEADTLLCLLPLQHVFASIVNVFTPLYIGARVVFADTLKRSEILEAMREAHITILATVPQFFYLFHNRIKDELARKSVLVRKAFGLMLPLNRYCRRFLKLNCGKLLFSKVHENFGDSLWLFVSGGSAFDPKVAQEFHDLGFTIIQGYGLTETTGGCTVTRVHDNVIGSVGKSLPGTEISIDAPDASGIGEVLIRGPLVMKGYYKDPEATAEATRGGWFHSGDLGRLDEKGNLFITGRVKEVIVLPNGKNIYPDEIETHYLQSPFISEIAALGIASLGTHGTSERLHGLVVPNFDVLKEKRIANAREILRDEIGRLSIQLPKYKRLMSYQIRKDPLPRTTTQKIKRLELKNLIESGQMRDTDLAQETRTLSQEDRATMSSAMGQEVLGLLKDTYHRNTPIEPDTNLELDLGFDSMERIELLASLEQTLNLDLPDDFGAELHTVRDLIVGLERLAGGGAGSGSSVRQSWTNILSEESVKPLESEIRFAGEALTVIKFIGLKLVYVICRIFLSMQVRGLRNLPPTGPYLLCPNHLSYIDPLVVCSALPYRHFRRAFFVGASEYIANWFSRMLARWTNTIPVDPDAQLLRAMKVGAHGLRRGRVLCIFPEGARSFDGELKEFKKGAAILSRETGAPIVPVGIRGTHEVWGRDSSRIRLHDVTVAFGSPILLGPARGSDPYQADTDILRNTVAQLIY